MLMMTCAGASEQAVSQWASTFAETSLPFPKHSGDLAGPLTLQPAWGFPAALREMRRQDPAGSVHERKLHSLHPFLFMYFHPSISCAEPFGMCALRILRWNYVARTFQHRIRLYSTWRHNNVCPPCTCRRSRDVPVVRRLQVWYLPTPAAV